jgi:hypothetical protein
MPAALNLESFAGSLTQATPYLALIHPMGSWQPPGPDAHDLNPKLGKVQYRSRHACGAKTSDFHGVVFNENQGRGRTNRQPSDASPVFDVAEPPGSQLRGTQPSLPMQRHKGQFSIERAAKLAGDSSAR